MVGESLFRVANRERHGALPSFLLVFSFVLFTALCGRVAFPLPFTPVPVTLQVFSVFLVGLTTAPLEAFSVMALYVAGGVLGVPWFAKFGGYATLGYLLGFVVGAPLCSWAKTKVGSGVACLMALLVIYFLGVSFLCLAIGTSALKGVLLGALPFIPFDLLKAVASIKLTERIRAHDNS
jgi:biotin transport system substrate-specific component